jgi:hypothetical protein
LDVRRCRPFVRRLSDALVVRAKSHPEARPSFLSKSRGRSCAGDRTRRPPLHAFRLRFELKTLRAEVPGGGFSAASLLLEIRGFTTVEDDLDFQQRRVIGAIGSRLFRLLLPACEESAVGAGSAHRRPREKPSSGLSCGSSSCMTMIAASSLGVFWSTALNSQIRRGRVGSGAASSTLLRALELNGMLAPVCQASERFVYASTRMVLCLLPMVPIGSKARGDHLAFCALWIHRRHGAPCVGTRYRPPRLRRRFHREQIACAKGYCRQLSSPDSANALVRAPRQYLHAVDKTLRRYGSYGLQER